MFEYKFTVKRVSDVLLRTPVTRLTHLCAPLSLSTGGHTIPFFLFEKAPLITPRKGKNYDGSSNETKLVFGILTHDGPRNGGTLQMAPAVC